MSRAATQPSTIQMQRGHKVADFVRNPGSIWIEGHRATLPNNQWVAADGTGLVAHDSSYDGLVVQVKTRGIDLALVAIAYISSDPV
jgi:hypothetical protein